MRDLWKYLLVGFVVFILVFVGVALLFPLGYGGYGMMGGWGYLPFFGGFGMMSGFMILFFFLLPLAVIGLIVYGVAALVRRPPQMTPPPPVVPARNCPACGRPAQADWTTCPYCGEKL